MICSPSEAEQYNKLIATPVSDPSSNPSSKKDSR